MHHIPAMTRLPLAALALLAPFSAFAADKAPARPTITPQIAAEFKARDLNHDGFLTRDEIAKEIAGMRVAGQTNSPARVKMLTDAWIASADANHDGKVSPMEMQRLMIAVASRYDTNHDGVVSVAEQRAAQTKMLDEVRAGPPKPAAGR